MSARMIELKVNGRLRQVLVEKTSLLEVLREQLRLTGTKNGCACTVRMYSLPVTAGRLLAALAVR